MRDTKQGEAILMAPGIMAPATILTAICCQCRMGYSFYPFHPEIAPQQLRELQEALAALLPLAT